MISPKSLFRRSSSEGKFKDLISKNRVHVKKYFFEDWYIETYGDQIEDTSKALRHYLREGWSLGNYPNPFFSPRWYAATYPKAGSSGLEPLTYWFAFGRAAGHVPSPVFDSVGYLKLHPDIAEAGLEPFLHYIHHGVREGRHPGLPPEEAWRRGVEAANFDITHAARLYATPQDYVDADWYREHYRASIGVGLDPYQDYAGSGWRLGRQPNPFFSPSWYLKQYPEAAALDIDPLVHWFLAGRMQGAKPSPAFDPAGYLAREKDIAEAGLEPFLHFVRHGAREGREPGFPLRELPERRAAAPHFDWNAAAAALGGVADAPGHQRRRALRALTPADRRPLPASTRDPVALGFLEEKARAATVLSFDIWDTVLRRDCHPDEIKLRTARALWLIAGRMGVPVGHLSPAELLEMRRQAEAAEANHEHEYRAEQVFERWLGALGLRDDAQIRALRDALIDSELSAEIASTRVDETVGDFLASGPVETRLAISDFYFGGDFLSRILAARGLDDAFSQLFVSCDHMQTKRGGGLFPVVRQGLAGNGAGWLHVGDNLLADYKAPMKQGVDAFHYRNAEEEEARAWYGQAYEKTLVGDLTEHYSRIRAELEALAEAEAADDPLKRFGIGFAPMATAYALFALEQGVRANVEKLFFFTREGVFVKRLYDALVAADVYDLGDYPPSEILAVSRRATFAASLRALGSDELLRMWGQYNRQSVTAFARSLNLDLALVARIARRLDLDADAEIAMPWQSPELKRLLSDPEMRDHVSAALTSQRGELTAYLRNRGFDPDAAARYGIVDIGWRGTIQDNLAYLSRATIHGVYLGLDHFINDQPANATKAGYLFDRNRNPKAGLRDYAPVEFLFNATGGSVIGYDKGQPVTLVVPGEEAVIATAVRRMQEGLALGNGAVAGYVRRHGLTAADLQPLANELIAEFIKHPPREVADAFMALEHNETFGTGAVQEMGASAFDIDALAAMTPEEMHGALSGATRAIRWPSAMIGVERVRSRIDGLPLENRLAFPRGTLFPAPSRITHSGTDSIAFFCPAPIRGSGGHRTIFNIARGLHEAGFDCQLLFDAQGDGLGLAEQVLGTSEIPLYGRWDASVTPAAAFATVHYSSRYVRDLFAARGTRTYYLVQDFEAAFNPVGDTFVEAENSYTMGHTHITIGNWLTHVLSRTYGARAVPAGLGVDPSVYRPLDAVAKEPAIAFLYQPEKPRRMTRLAIEALAIVKKRRPDIRVLLYGSNRKADLPFDAENLGIVTDLRRLNHLYNRCTAGLCVSLTNPSRIPFEMMAAGCVPVDLYRYNNLFDYPSDAVKLAYQSPASVAEALLALFVDPEETELRRERGIGYMRPRSLDWEIDVAVNAVAHTLRGGSIDELPMPVRMHHEPPVIAEADDSPAVQAYCRSQARLCED